MEKGKKKTPSENQREHQKGGKKEEEKGKKKATVNNPNEKIIFMERGTKSQALKISSAVLRLPANRRGSNGLGTVTNPLPIFEATEGPVTGTVASLSNGEIYIANWFSGNYLILDSFHSHPESLSASSSNYSLGLSDSLIGRPSGGAQPKEPSLSNIPRWSPKLLWPSTMLLFGGFLAFLPSS
ncbi:hypothetical protein C8J57DRAFT_1469418 [Mycena rebaudengoi]|nr:hypothetical protein C8J57DRAFT_1469418 [Mycena rebaudengoi]